MGKECREMVWRGVRRGTLKGSAFGVLLAIADHADDATGVAWPSVPTLADCANVAERTVYNCLPKLAGLNFITIVSGGGQFRPNEYRLNLPLLQSLHEQWLKEQNARRGSRQRAAPAVAPGPPAPQVPVVPPGATLQVLQGNGRTTPDPVTGNPANQGEGTLQNEGINPAKAAGESDSRTGNLEQRDDSNQRSHQKNSGSFDRAGQNGVAQSGHSPPAGTAAYSPYVAAVVTDFSDELGDSSHKVANVTQALRLWSRAKLAEREFVEVLYEAKRRTRAYQGKQGARGISNKMAYFFTVLRDLVEGNGEPGNSAVAEGVDRAPPASAPAVGLPGG